MGRLQSDDSSSAYQFDDQPQEYQYEPTQDPTFQYYESTQQDSFPDQTNADDPLTLQPAEPPQMPPSAQSQPPQYPPQLAQPTQFAAHGGLNNPAYPPQGPQNIQTQATRFPPHSPNNQAYPPSQPAQFPPQRPAPYPPQNMAAQPVQFPPKNGPNQPQMAAHPSSGNYQARPYPPAQQAYGQNAYQASPLQAVSFPPQNHNMPPGSPYKPAQPSQIAAQGIPIGSQGQTEGWKTGLFDCMEDPMNAIITACFPCITFGQIAEVVDNGHTTCATSGLLYGLIAGFIGIPCIMSCIYRTKLRAKYGLVEAPAPDWITHFLCEWCSLCQEYRELQRRGLDPAIGWQGNLMKQQQQPQVGMSMMPPTNQKMKP